MAPADKLPCQGLRSLVRRVRRGYVDVASPDLSLIPREPNYVGTGALPVHSGPWDYLARVPLVLYGPGLVRDHLRLQSPATMADLAPTTAELIGYEDFPHRDGRILEEALTEERPVARLVVSLVWDGAGWNVLNQHEGSWPYLRSLIRRGVVYDRFEIGSSPSVTPPIHTTLGTGAFPRHHGISGLRMRKKNGDYVGSFSSGDSSRVRIPTLADLYDRDRGNRPITGMVASVNWHLGMLGHGRGTPGGDADPALLVGKGGKVAGDLTLYRTPRLDSPARLLAATRRLDAVDGELDGEWLGHSLDDTGVRHVSPAHVAYHEHILERFIATEQMGLDDVPDLLYVNFKSSDGTGHKFGMTSEETGEAVAAQDRALKRLVSLLDRRVGRGRWAVMLTADHGQTPYPEESGGWPIGGAELSSDANAALDRNDNGVDVVERVTSAGAYVNRSELDGNGLSLPEVARWIGDYSIGESLKDGEELPRRFEGRENERLFDAVMAGPRLAVVNCRR